MPPEVEGHEVVIIGEIGVHLPDETVVTLTEAMDKQNRGRGRVAGRDRVQGDAARTFYRSVVPVCQRALRKQYCNQQRNKRQKSSQSLRP